MFDARTTKSLLAVVTPVLMVGMAACGGGGGGESSAPASTGQSQAPAQQPVEVANAATLRGVINFQGDPPANTPIDMSEEPQCASVHTQPPVQNVVAVRNGRLANVFVYVKEGLSGPAPAATQPAVIDQVGCVYVPRIIGMQTGQDLLVRNSDPLLHNVNVQPTNSRGFNFSQPNRMETSRQRPFGQAEVMIPVRCNVHGWMQAFIGVVDHPYFAVSGDDGSFEIPRLPPGTYVLEAWHERYGTQTLNVTVGPNEVKEDVVFTYAEAMAADAVVPLGEPIDLHDHTSGAHEHAADE